MKQFLTAALAATALALGGVVVSATPIAPALAASAATPAPTCVSVQNLGRVGGFPTVRITNGCSSTQRVKAIWAFGRDGACVSLQSGYRYTSSSGAAARFDGLVRC